MVVAIVLTTFEVGVTVALFKGSAADGKLGVTLVVTLTVESSKTSCPRFPMLSSDVDDGVTLVVTLVVTLIIDSFGCSGKDERLLLASGSSDVDMGATLVETLTVDS